MRAIIVVTMGLFVLAACSHSSSNNNCDSQTVSDFNQVVDGCTLSPGAAHSSDCQSAAQSFLRNHPNVSCSAVKMMSGNADTISSDKIRAVLKASMVCGPNTIDDYNQLLKDCSSGDKDSCQISDQTFLDTHSDVNCTAVDPITGESIQINSSTVSVLPDGLN